MGSWNKTCGLSNLHIYCGEPVYVFVLEQAERYDPCNATSLFRPLLIPFECKYDDYGGGEDCNGVALNLIIEGLRNHLVEVDVGSNKVRDIAITKETFDETEFFKAVHYERLHVNAPYSTGKVPINFTMFRKDIVDRVLEQYEISRYVGTNKGTQGPNNSYITYRFKDVVAHVRPLIDRWIQVRDSDRPETFAQFITLKSITPDNTQESLVAKWLTGDRFRYSQLVDLWKVINQLSNASSVDIQYIESLLIEYIRGAFLDNFMNAARKTWIPGGHEGSQSTSDQALIVLYDATIDVLKREKASVDF